MHIRGNSSFPGKFIFFIFTSLILFRFSLFVTDAQCVSVYVQYIYTANSIVVVRCWNYYLIISITAIQRVRNINLSNLSIYAFHLGGNSRNVYIYLYISLYSHHVLQSSCTYEMVTYRESVARFGSLGLPGFLTI